MKSVKKSFMALLLAMLMLFSIVPVGSADVTADADPGTVKLELSEYRDGYILDVYLLNMSSFYCAWVSLEYNKDDLSFYQYNQHLISDNEDYECHNYDYFSGYIIAETEFYRNADLHLYSYYFSRKTEVLAAGAEFVVEITTYLTKEDYSNDNKSYTNTGTISIPREIVDPSVYPDALKSGDINGDKKIDATDARHALRMSADLVRYFSILKKYADVDGDNKISASDARLILRISVGLDSEDSAVYFLPPKQSSESSSRRDVKEITLTEGEILELSDVIVRAGSGAKWTSSNTKAVKVTKDGKITALKKGFSCIILECGDEKLYYGVTVKTELQNKIEALKEKYPSGYYWNNYAPSKDYPHVTETPCSDHKEGKYSKCKGQCAGFAALLFSEVFPNAKKKTGVTWDTVKIGDYVRLKKHHSIFITDVIKKGDVIGYDYWSEENRTASEDYVVVAHCNWYWSCDITWDYPFTTYYDIDSSLSYTAY